MRLRLTSSRDSRTWNVACPENDTLSGLPLTVPLIGTRALLQVRTALAGGAACNASPPAAGTESRVLVRNARREFMVRSLFRKHFSGVTENHALWPRDRRRQRSKERRSSVVDLPTQQHGVVLVRRVMAVLHEHPAPVPE